MIQTYIAIEERRFRISKGYKAKYAPIMNVNDIIDKDNYDSNFDVSSSQSVIEITDFLPTVRVPCFDDIIFKKDLKINFSISKEDYAQYRMSGGDEYLHLTAMRLSEMAWISAIRKRISNKLIGKVEGTSVFGRLLGLWAWDHVMESKITDGEACAEIIGMFREFLDVLYDEGYSKEFLDGYWDNKGKETVRHSLSKAKLAIDKWKNDFLGKNLPKFIYSY